MTTVNNYTIIGRAEKIQIPSYSKAPIAAKIDTGADLSSIWATSITEKDGHLEFMLFGPSSEHYTGEIIKVPKGDYRVTRVASSFGHKEIRYVVRVGIKLGGRSVKTTFTLSNRSNKTYPVLIGRKLLKGKFLVDVTKGEPLKQAEKDKKRALKRELEKMHNTLEA